MQLNKFKLQLKTFMPYRLSVTSNRISTLIATVYAERFGLSIPEWRVIAILGDLIQKTSTELVELTAMDKVAVSRAVSSLVKKNLIRRSAVQHDGRLNMLNLTQEGITVYEEIAPQALELEKQMLQYLSPAEEQQLHQILDKLGARLDDFEAV